MLHIIPEDQYKRVKLNDHIEVTGYKSDRYDYSDGHNHGKIDPEGAHLSISTDGGVGAQFELYIRNRTNLLKLREAINFALEEDKEEKNAPY